jgi:hypothetical protein
MKTKSFNKWVALLPIFLLSLSGCYTPPKPAYAGPPFREDSPGAVVFQFSRWDSIYMMRPDYRYNGFLVILNREKAAQVLASPNLRRDIGVVTLGWTYAPEQEAAIIGEWKTLFAKNGFRRFVVLRGDGKDINGLPVIYDSGMLAGL